MRIITSWDDGTRDDERLVELLRRYELPAIFFVPIMSWGYKNINVYSGFEIGCHTYTHPPDLKQLDDGRLKTEIDLAKELLEKKTGKEIEWFCYPRGRYDERIIRKVAKAGFKFARTTKIGFHIEQDYYYIHNWEIRGYHCYQRLEYKGLDWVEYIKQIIPIAQENDAVEIHIWGHSWEIEKNGWWDNLEELFRHLHGINK